MDWELYDLLGFGGLTPEIVEYLTTYLDICSDLFDSEKIVRLFKRLENFYVRWCDGEFIDAEPPTLPQRKMRLLKEQVPDRENLLGQRHVDVYTGLNIMILLLELHRYAHDLDELKEQIIFYPSGKLPEDASEDDVNYRLHRVIHYADCLDDELSFKGIAGSFFAHAQLARVSFSHNNFRSANFSSADFEKAFLIRVFFIDANLTSTNLKGARLRNALFIRANLEGANLESTDLNYAILEGANLQNANLSFADLDKIIWDEDTNWEGVQGLETAVNVPEALKRQLGLE